ncbi:MAG: LLM class F420-dependent oxidoreductase [Actinomycetota bacterium]
MFRYGLQIPWFSWEGSPGNHRQVLADIARAAEDAGYHSLWVMDHFFQLPAIGDATHDMHESYTTLGYLAGVTERVTLGTLVTGVTYRHPPILVKQITSLDVLSGGRAWCAIGAAWFEREHQGFGVEFPPVRERFEKLEEALQIALQMWSDDDGPYKGKHFVLEETICTPKPLQQPHPPIMVGGEGEKKTLRLVAKYADACNIHGGPDEIRHKREVIRRHADDAGRDFSEIEITRLSTAFSADHVAEEAPGLIEAGVDHLIYNMPAIHTLEPVREIGKVLSEQG